jgi:Domain of unknown function (DUF1905)
VGHVYRITGEVELFPQNGGWYFVRVPVTITDELEHIADRGLVAVSATVGDTNWDTSLLPMGDATKFIALNARVRTTNHLQLGDLVTVRFSLRTR